MVTRTISGPFTSITHAYETWLGPETCVDIVENRNPRAENRTPNVQPIARLSTDWAVPARDC
jgi:hypothetical protein